MNVDKCEGLHRERERHILQIFTWFNIFYATILYEKQRLHSTELRLMISFNRLEYSQLSMKRKRNDVIASSFPKDLQLNRALHQRATADCATVFLN